MPTSRLEAFSDGVLAIIITVMVLELEMPKDATLGALWHDSGTSLLTYVLSFVYVGIYWNNHHHMFQLTERVTGPMLWANLHLLFWLSLYPFTTAWMDDQRLARVPLTIYGVNLLGAAIAYYVLQRTILHAEGRGGRLHQAVGRDLKGKLSPVCYIAGIIAALKSGPDAPWATFAALGFFVLVAVIWFIPDTRIERSVTTDAGAKP